MVDMACSVNTKVVWLSICGLRAVPPQIQRIGALCVRVSAELFLSPCMRTRREESIEWTIAVCTWLRWTVMFDADEVHSPRNLVNWTTSANHAWLRASKFQLVVASGARSARRLLSDTLNSPPRAVMRCCIMVYRYGKERNW